MNLKLTLRLKAVVLWLRWAWEDAKFRSWEDRVRQTGAYRSPYLDHLVEASEQLSAARRAYLMVHYDLKMNK